MKLDERLVKSDERAIFALRSLYRQYGYAQYKMSKFEEYDLYGRNKDFLVSDGIITFTDTSGKLMALKPDVTLSIVKNSKDAPGQVQKVYYNENVYRVAKSSHTFKEIMQTGLECIGDIGTYEICEVLLLALRSLGKISENYVLDISSMAIVSALIGELSLSAQAETEILSCIGKKNTHELTALCREAGVSEAGTARLLTLAATYGAPSQVIARLREIETDAMRGAIDEFEAICAVLADEGFGDRVRVDFSIVNDMHYYNGVVFRGYVEGIPSGVLSGGQYDHLLRRMGRQSGAVGFAVYLDLLERLGTPAREYDVDAVLLYGEDASPSEVTAAANKLTADGTRVLVRKTVPENVTYRQLWRVGERGALILENDD